MGLTREEKVIKQVSGKPTIQKQTPIATDMFLPNYSGVKDAAGRLKGDGLIMGEGEISSYIAEFLINTNIDPDFPSFDGEVQEQLYINLDDVGQMSGAVDFGLRIGTQYSTWDTPAVSTFIGNKDPAINLYIASTKFYYDQTIGGYGMANSQLWAAGNYGGFVLADGGTTGDYNSLYFFSESDPSVGDKVDIHIKPNYSGYAVYDSFIYLDGGLIKAPSLPSGTLASPPSGLVSGQIWQDTTTSSTHPMLRIKA